MGGQSPHNTHVLEKAAEVTNQLLAVLENLIPQPDADKIPPSKTELSALLNSEASTLPIARYPDKGGEIVGALTLAIYRAPTRVRSVVEDVIVDKRFH